MAASQRTASSSDYVREATMLMRGGGKLYTSLLISPGYRSCKLYILTGPSLSLVCVHLNHSQTLSLPNILHQTWSFPLHQLQLLNRKMSMSTFSASEADRTQCWPNVPLILARCYSDVCPMFLWRLLNVPLTFNQCFFTFHHANCWLSSMVREDMWFVAALSEMSISKAYSPVVWAGKHILNDSAH